MLLGTQALTVRYCFDKFLLRHYIHFRPKSIKMSNLRAPAKNIISLLQKSHYSSSNEKVGQELLKQVLDVGQNKANSDKLVNLLPYLQHKNTEYISRTNSSETQAEEKRESDPVELDKQGDHLKPLSIKGTSDEATPSHNVSESSKVPAQGSVIPEAFHEPPQSLPVLMLGQIKTPTVDLTNATLPLSLHVKEKKGFFVDAVTQDFNYVYTKNTSSVGVCCLPEYERGITLNMIDEMINQSIIIKDFLQKNDLFVVQCSKKTPPIGPFDPIRILDDLRGILTDIFDRTKKEKKFLHELKKEEEKLKKIEEKLEKLYKEHEGGTDKNKIKEEDKKKSE